MSKEFLSNLVHYRTYAKYLPELQRRENKNETIARYIKMMTDKFPNLKNEIEEYAKLIYSQKVVPSMRSFQFSGDPIIRRNNRIYNCSYLPITSFLDFRDLFMQSMSGTGVGFSIRKHHVSQLPLISEGAVVKPFIIEDSAEGWCDSLVALLQNCDIQFDYTEIRPSGSPLSTGGTASGPKALIHMHAQVRFLLRKATNRKLTPFECHRICCLIADCVVVGGVRRGALISLFDYDDEETLNCKAGTWWEKYPELARANNSACVRKDDLEFKIKAEKVIQACFDGGQAEPGLSLTMNDDWGFNPCQPSWAPILTKNGLRQMKDVNEGDEIWSETGWTKITKKWSTGIKKVYAYTTTSGVFYGTENHKVLSEGEKIEIKDAEKIDVLVGPYVKNTEFDIQLIMDGLILGDGSCHKASNNLIYLNIGQYDTDYFDSEIKSLLTKYRPGLSPYAWEVETNIKPEEMVKTFLREVPDRYVYADRKSICSFLRGLYSANGSIADGRATLKASSFKVIEKVQYMLSSIGIQSYWTRQKGAVTNFSNGVYKCKDSYDLNITSDRLKFIESIGYIQEYKVNKLQVFIDKITAKTNGRKKSYDIVSTEFLSEEEVFDITVDNSTHTYWTSGSNVSNCHEIALRPYGVCNLTEINAAKCFSKEDWLKAVEAATVFGTLQASFTDFKGVQPMWKQVAEEDALLGVSITGQAENQALLNEENLKEGAILSVKVNKEWAQKIGINPAKRITTTKPSGSSSSWLGTTAGVHAGHETIYLRRVRLDKETALGKALVKYFPEFIVEEKFNSNNIIMQIPIKLYDNVLLRSQEGALQCLERVKKIYNTWILNGHIEGDNTHNISLTINYHEHEKAAIKDWMIQNKDFYYGISLIPFDGGDYDYLPYSQPFHKELYEILAKRFDKICEEFSFDNIKEKKDHTDMKGESACAGGACVLEI